MYFHLIACQVFQREISYLISGCTNVISVTWLPQGLHDTPALLKTKLEKAMDDVLDEVESGRMKHKPDAFLLCYGLCSNGTVGLKAKEIPIVIPKTDDCIALFLGSEERYLRLFSEKSGTYWLNNGWIETSFLPTKDEREKRRLDYIEKYGDDNADYLMEQELLYMKNYSRCGYISSQVYESSGNFAAASRLSEEWGLELFTEQGDISLIQKLVSGDWNEKEFAVCPKGYSTAPAYDGSKITVIR